MTEIFPFLKALLPPSHHDRVVLVGGTVRDLLLGRKSQDTDLVAAFSPEEFSALGFRLVEATSGAHVYFRHHPQFGSIEATCITSMMDLEADLLRLSLIHI